MDKQAFKQRMQNLKSYRENNPGKGYWDWKVQAYQNGGDIPLWQQYQYSGPSYQDVLDDLKQNSPSTYNQLQQSKAADSQSSSEIVRYVDSKGRLQSTSNLQGLSPVITSDYLPGIGDAMEVTQIVQDVKNEDYGAALAGLGLLALPGNWLSKIKSKYGKKGLVNSIYNNVAPGSYYDSYIPGGSKKDELKGALKDYLLGKGDKIDPKWENWINSPTTLGSFIAKDNKKQQHMLDVMTAARKEAWQNYLGIPHDDRYLINTGIKENGMPVYRSNVTDVPNVQLRDIAKTTQHKPESIPYVHGDMINSTGGNISVKYKDNGDLRTITTEDIWDLNPFKDANRARILPEWLKNKYMHIEVQPDGYQKRVWNDNAPKWLIDLEPANLLGIPGPFLNRTTFNARLLNKDQAVKKVPISKEEYVNKRFGTELELIDPSEMTDKEFQKWKKLTQNRYSEEYDRLNEQQSERLFEFVPKTEEELLDKYGIYVKKYSDGGEVSEFQRKTRRDIMQESLVDGRPDYNKMFQNQNEYQKDFANYWYTERAKNPKYSDQIGGDKLGSVLSNIDKATWKTPTEAMRDNMVGQGYNPTDAQINQQLNILKEKGTKGFANPKAHSYTSLRPANTWHEGVGHMVGDNTPAILNASPNVRISNPDSSYEDYVNQANEKHAQTWDFRGNNSNLKDDQGNYYIDPNRQLTPEDISNMRSRGAKIPEQWESLEDADISELTNTFAYNMYQDPVQYMANGGEVGDPDDEFTKAINTKLGRTPDGRPKEQGLKPVIDLEDAVNVTPIGDVLSAKDAYNAARNNDWLGVGLATATMIPFVPRAISTVRRSTPTVKNYRSSLSNALDKAVKLGEKERRMSARLNNETYETVQRLMDDPSYMRRAQQVKEKYGDDYTQIYADLIDAYNNSPELLPKAKRTAFEDNARARMATTTESTKRHMDGGEFPKMGEYEYQYDINGVPYGTTIHEMNHNADYLKNKAADADANSNLYYWMRSALKPFSRIDPNTDKLTKYYSKPTEQKAYMNQLREFMYANKMIDTRDQIVTPDLIKQAISKLPKGMQSIKKASEQFKSMRSYTKWFNTIPLLGVGAVGANKYFTSNENRD